MADAACLEEATATPGGVGEEGEPEGEEDGDGEGIGAGNELEDFSYPKCTPIK